MQALPGTQQLTRKRPMVLSATEAASLETLKHQRSRVSWPYYSTVKFVALASGDPSQGAVTYDTPIGTEVRAFSYRVRGAKLAAGYTAADGLATIADTNLTSESETTAGQNVMIHGLAVQIVPTSLHLNDGEALPHRARLPDARFLAALYESVSVLLTLNGDQQVFRLGTLGMIPGAGGLMGGSFDDIGDTSLAGNDAQILFPQNGWPTRSNFFKIPEGLTWRARSKEDSQLNVVFNVTRAIRLLSGGSPEHNIQDVAFANAIGTQSTGEGKAFPTELLATFKVFMVGQVVGPRTRTV
jgi:hypothetical protein